MAIRMYDFAGEETARRFSPFCWRSRMALAHKGLSVETIPWRFTEKRYPLIPAGKGSGHRGRRPVLSRLMGDRKLLGRSLS